ncbi:unnamed protein product, partial [Prorocentrum cordatum]
EEEEEEEEEEGVHAQAYAGNLRASVSAVGPVFFRRSRGSMAIAHCTPHRSDRRPPVLGRAETPKVDVDGSSVRLRLQPHPSFGCASHLQGTRESRNRWARPPSAGRRAASRRGAGKRTRRGRPRTSARYARSSSPSRRVEKAITKNPAPSAATTKSARSTCLCTVGNSQLQHTCAPQGAGIVSNPTAPGAMLPQRRAQRC